MLVITNPIVINAVRNDSLGDFKLIVMTVFIIFVFMIVFDDKDCNADYLQ